jgi:quercetin dioxygenase-like cupin family protein
VPAPGETLENAQLATRLLWRETGSHSNGERVAAELWMNSDAAERPPHLHPKMSEKLSVLAGRARVRVGETEHLLGPGESLDFPAGTPHAFGRASQEELHVLLEGWPALEWDEFTTEAWKIGLSERGRPDMLRMSLLMRRYPDRMYMAAAPIPVQRALFAVLATVARVMGKRLPE